MELLRDFYAPSLANQTDPDFRVILACHPDTPRNVLDELGKSGDLWFSQIHEYPYEEGDITTRLDSDDMIHRDFVKSVKSVKADCPTLVDFDTGFYDLNTGKIGVIDRPLNNSQFLSVVHSTRELGCYCGNHTNAHRKFSNQKRFHFIGGIQVVHDANVYVQPGCYHRTKKINLSLYGQ